MKTKNRHDLDLLNGPIWSKLLWFALPLAATGILQQLFNAADIAVVGRFVGEAAMAAVGSNGPVINLVVNLFVGISLGANVIISQFVGHGDHEGIHRAVYTSIIVAVVGGVGVAVLGQMIAAPMVRALGVPDDVYDMSLLYLRIYLGGIPVILLYNFEAAIFRSQGDTKTPLAVLAVSGVVNVGLNLFFVLVLGRTVDGVAIATVSSNLVSSVLLFVLLCRSETDVKIRVREFCFDGRILRRILRVGIPAGIQGMVFSLANLCVQSAVNSLGTVVMAASSAAGNLETFSYQIVSSYGQAATTFVGQNYGAGQLDRCHKCVVTALLVDGVSVAIMAGLIFTFSGPLLRIFNTNPDVVTFGVVRLKYMFMGHAFSVFVEVLSGYLRGFGLSLVPAICTLVCICGIRISWVFMVFPQNPTFERLMIVYPISLSTTAAILALVCLRERKVIATKQFSV